MKTAENRLLDSRFSHVQILWFPDLAPIDAAVSSEWINTGILGGPYILLTVGSTWQGDSLIGQGAGHGAGRYRSFKPHTHTHTHSQIHTLITSSFTLKITTAPPDEMSRNLHSSTLPHLKNWSSALNISCKSLKIRTIMNVKDYMPNQEHEFNQ